MSDIAERLRAVSGCTQKTFLHSLNWEDGRKIITEAANEIERLRALVEEAFDEGADQGIREIISLKGGYSWAESKSKAALTVGKPEPSP